MLDGPIIDAARKWHAAYRKAQNSNLMRAKEVERLRSQLEESQIKYGVDIASTDLHWQDEIAAKDARIKGLEGLCVRACMEAGWTDEEIREALERIKSNEKL